MSLIRKHVAVLQAWACLDLVGHSALLLCHHYAILSLLFSCSPYCVFLHFCIFYYCDISCSCVWQLAFYSNEMNVTIDTGVIVICFVYRLYISECVWHLLLIKKWMMNDDQPTCVYRKHEMLTLLCLAKWWPRCDSYLLHSTLLSTYMYVCNMLWMFLNYYGIQIHRITIFIDVLATTAAFVRTTVHQMSLLTTSGSSQRHPVASCSDEGQTGCWNVNNELSKGCNLMNLQGCHLVP